MNNKHYVVINVVFQNNLSDNPIICGIYATKDAAKECIGAAKKIGLHRWSEMHVIQTEYDFDDDYFVQEEEEDM